MKPYAARPRAAVRRRRCDGLMALLLTLGLLLALVCPALAADGALDPAFDPGEGVQHLPGMRGRINYDDGTNRFLIWGYFTSINGVPRGSLARFNADGSLDTGFNPPIKGEVRTVYLMSNGKILVGGRISVGSSSPYHYNLARLTSDGALDSTFYEILDWYGMVNSVKVQSDGKVLVGGWSMTVLGDASATYHLLRLNTNGTVDNSYPKRSAPGGLVNSITVLTANDARIYGILPNISGTHTGYLVTLSLSGNLVSYLGDETFNGPIYDYGTQTDGKKVYVGHFTEVLGFPRKYIARLDTNGALDTSFDPGIGPNGRVNNLVIQADDKLVVAGNFNTFNNNPVGYAVRLNTDATVDSTFAASADDRIQKLNLLNGTGSDLVAFGWFRNFNGAARPGLAYMDSNGNLYNLYTGWTSANTDTAYVYALAVQPNGQVWVGGDFTGVGGKMHRAWPASTATAAWIIHAGAGWTAI
ncbi:MAG: delta-60 repeat domain-containing protein [Proteobacteria bacterium]|nr:delta-60 repeat domain-containing protein [Pseudomonadota bacterium]MBU4357486.1 delta-60 repeat domain-containing protein [Pseudomonadota bacterium]